MPRKGPNRIYLVLEYCAGGDLAAYIQSHGKVSEVNAGHFMRQLAMAENKTIEITGSERFSNYAGYGGTFRYAGDFLDSSVRDHKGRRRTKIIATDAKARPAEAQFQQKLLLREICKAYCGFISAENVDETPESQESISYTWSLLLNVILAPNVDLRGVNHALFCM